MTRLFRQLSIRTKLIVLLVGTSLGTLVISGSILWVYQFVHDRHLVLSEETASAQIVSDDVSTALLFDDPAVAKEGLSQLREDQDVEQACLYDAKGALFARYTARTAHTPCPEVSGPALVDIHRHLILRQPVLSQRQRVGVLVLMVGLDEMYSSLLRFAETTLTAALIALSIAALLATRLQRVISKPILHLTHVASQVSTRGSYLLRAHRFSNDETGLLIDQFNTMMDRIQEREEELQRAHDHLEDKVSSRTRALEQEIVERKLIERDLQTARIAAENASRAKSAFLANMSHELRTPLNAVIGYSEILHEDAVAKKDEEMASDLEKILTSARHLLTLISDVLDLSKIEAGKLKLTPVLISAKELLQEVLPTAQVLALRNHNELIVEETLDSELVEVDTLRLRQCLLNLVSNACKFTENGAITLRTDRDTHDGREFAVWRVIDTGIGIAHEHVDRLFHTFTQVDDSSTRRFGGSGLGLAISQQLCHAMGGYISVSSRVGEGSSFSIYIPIAEPSTTELSSAA